MIDICFLHSASLLQKDINTLLINVGKKYNELMSKHQHCDVQTKYVIEKNNRLICIIEVTQPVIRKSI